MNRSTNAPRFRMHWLSWAVMVVLLWIMGLITLSGVEASANESERRIGQDVVQTYGWPLEFQRSRYLDWITIRPIPLFGEVYSFNLLALAVDLAILFAVVGFGGWMTERHWRRRRWSVSIFELLVACAAMAVVLGWYQMHRQRRLNETRGIQALEDLGKSVFYKTITRPQEPKWFQRLVGSVRSFPLFHPVSTVAIHCTSETADEAMSAFANFREAKVVEVNRYLIRSEFVDLVSDMPHLHKLSLNYRREAPSEPSGTTGGFLAPYSHYLTPSQLEKSVAQIKTDLQLFRELDQLDSVETLQLKFPEIDLSTWNKLPPLTKLTYLGLSGDLLIEDLAKLDDYPLLKNVFANVIATRSELEDFQSRHPQLVLSYGQSMTPMTVAWRRLERLSGSQELNLDRLHIDLAGVPLDAATLALLNPVDLEEVATLKVGAVTSPTALAKLIKRCPTLEDLDLSKVEFSKAEIDQLNLSKLPSLTIRQGKLTVSDFIDLENKVQPSILTIANAVFSAQEIAELEKVWPDAYFDVRDSDEEDVPIELLGNYGLPLRKQITMEIDFYRDKD